jgi:hypothetical protein
MYQFILFLHIVALAIGLAAGGILLVCLIQLRAAKTLEQAAPFGAVAGRVEKAFPVAILGLFATGAYMTSDVWTWSTPWIDVAIAGLVVLGVQGPLVGGRQAHQLKHALMANGPGPLSEPTRRMARHPRLWWAELANLGVVFGVIWNMTHKAGWTESIVAVLVGYAAGAALSLPISSSHETVAEPAGEPAG